MCTDGQQIFRQVAFKMKAAAAVSERIAINAKGYMFGIPGAGKGYGKFYKVLDRWIEVHGNGEIGEIRKQDRNTMNYEDDEWEKLLLKIEQDNIYNNDKDK